MEVKYGREAGHSWHNQLCAAAETDRAMGIDAAHADFEFGFGHNAVDIDRRAIIQTAIAHQVTGHKVVGRCGIGGGHVRAHLFDDLLLCQGAVGSAADNDHRLGLGHAGLGQLRQHMGQHLRRGRGPAQIIDDDGGAGPSLGRVADAGRANRVLEGRRDLGWIKGGRALAAADVDIPAGRESERAFNVSIPGAGGDGYGCELFMGSSL